MVDLADHVAFQATDDVAHGPVDRGVELPMPAVVDMRCFLLVIPEPVGTGLMPASFANAASLFMRSGPSPADHNHLVSVTSDERGESGPVGAGALDAERE